MVIDSFAFFVLQNVGFLFMFLISVMFLIPKGVSYYSKWKSTGKSKFLSAASACFVVAVFCLSADLAMFVSAFVRKV